MQVTIIGAGEIGLFVAERLVQEKHDVTIVDVTNKVAEHVKESLDAMVICGDATNPTILEKAIGIDNIIYLPELEIGEPVYRRRKSIESLYKKYYERTKNC